MLGGIDIIDYNEKKKQQLSSSKIEKSLSLLIASPVREAMRKAYENLMNKLNHGGQRATEVHCYSTPIY